MSESLTPIIRMCSLLTLSLAMAVFLEAVREPLMETAARHWNAHARVLQRLLDSLRMRFPASRLVFFQLWMSLGALSSLVLYQWWVTLFCVAGLTSVKPVLLHLRDRRIALLESQIEAWLQTLAGLLHSTGSLGEAIERSHALTPAPLAEELAVTLQQLRMGSSLTESLVAMGERVGSRPLRSALGALRVGARSGGELRNSLQDGAAVMREMARLEGVLRTRTAEARSQGGVLALMPALLIGLLSFMDPEFLNPLWDTTSGNLVLALACGIWLVAVIWMRRILDVDI